jgi:hypothetical protein
VLDSQNRNVRDFGKATVLETVFIHDGVHFLVPFVQMGLKKIVANFSSEIKLSIFMKELPPLA